MTPDEVVVVLKTGVEKSYAMSAISSIVAADNSFKYFPAQETFDEFLAKSAAVRGVTIVRDETPDVPGGGTRTEPRVLGGVSDGYARMIGMQPPATPQVTSTGGGFSQVGGFAGASQRPQGLARLEPPVIPELDGATVAVMEEQRKAAELEASTPKFALPGGAVAAVTPSSNNKPFALPAAGAEVLICSNPACQKEVPGAQYGQKCPHCGIIWASQSNSDALAAAAANPGGPLVDPRNPFAKSAPAAGNNAPHNAAAPAVLAPPEAVAPAAEGLNLENIPWWGKALGFGASILLLMFIMQRR